jgi:hypothetical protein
MCGVARLLTRLTTDDIHADTLHIDVAGMLPGPARCMRDAHKYVRRQSAEQVIDRLERPARDGIASIVARALRRRGPG